MQEIDPLLSAVEKDLKPFVSELYRQGDPASTGAGESEEEDIPLFSALSQIRERYTNPVPLGMGGMKEVFKVYDAYAAREVAMALPKPDVPKHHYDAFLREAHITARLQHPCIINLFNMGVHEDGRPFFTMELKRGQSLRQILREVASGKLSEKYTLRSRLVIFLRVCEAIAYAHSRRVVHLDIKPENIQVGEYGEVQLCDWGIGEVLPNPQGETPTETLLDPDLYAVDDGLIRGTPGYMAPEQMEPHRHRTMAMDIYALGCLLGELATLQAPERFDRDQSTVDAVLKAIVKKARANNPSDRYASVGELRTDISRFLTGYSTSVEPHSFTREAVLFYRRNRLPCLITFGMLTIIAVATVVFMTILRAERIEAETARLDAENALQRFLTEQDKSNRRLAAQVAETIFETDTMSALIYRPLPPRDLYQRAIKQLNAVLANDPPPEAHVWSQRFYLYFQAQEFARAMEHPLPPNSEYAALWPVAEKFLSLVNTNNHLKTDDLIDLIQTLGSQRLALIEHILTLDLDYKRPLADRVKIVEAGLRAVNSPEWGDGKIILEESGLTRTVRFTGSGLKDLVLARGGQKLYAPCILAPLAPTSLDLRGTAISTLAELRGLNLLELDLRQTPIRTIRPLFNMPSLDRVHVEKGRFPAGDLKRLREITEVIEY